MGFTLGPNTVKNGHRLIAYDTIGSTNSDALDRARAGDPGRLWVVALEQTSGRGRRGRHWETPSGNLAATYLAILDEEAARHAPTLGFVAGVALHETLSALALDVPAHVALDHASGSAEEKAGLRLALKWPNDLLADGGKLSGILLESERLRSGELAVAVGIGLNVTAAPKGLPYKAVCLAELGCELTPQEAFLNLAETWTALERVWNGGAGIGQIRRLWLDRASGLGGPVTVRIGERVLRGIFETIDESGRLVVRAVDGTIETIAAAEVHFSVTAADLAQA